MSTDSLLHQLTSYESAILECMMLFKKKFGVMNPLRLWREGAIPRIGAISDSSCEYTLHGFGCTIERGARDLSFDFDGPEGFVYSPSKFYSYLSSESVEYSEVEKFFFELSAQGLLVQVPGRGVRLCSRIAERGQEQLNQ